eukprot:6797471-Pyramimonas_sp.AAC.1
MNEHLSFCGWSGDGRTYLNGNVDVYVGVRAGAPGRSLSLATAKGQEVQKKNLDPRGKAEFDISDQSEWETVLGSGASRVHPPRVARAIRRDFPARI